MGCLPCFGSSGKGEPAKKPAAAAGGGGARKDVPADRRASGVESDKSKPQGVLDSKKDAVIPREGNNQHIAAHTFTFRELAAATKNFRQDCLLGEGGFGRVYKGRLDNGQAVAVKQLDRNGLQGNREFLVEVLMLSLLHHDNLVNLIGYCADGDQRLLVYEFMPLGSLEDHLHASLGAHLSSSTAHNLGPRWLIRHLPGLSARNQPQWRVARNGWGGRRTQCGERENAAASGRLQNAMEFCWWSCRLSDKGAAAVAHAVVLFHGGCMMWRQDAHE